MSRIGNLPIPIPENTSIEVKGTEVLAKGSLGTLSVFLLDTGVISVMVENNQVIVVRNKEDKKSKSLHGLYRSLIKNILFGVNQSFNKTLELVGVGYRASSLGQRLELSLGYSHNIILECPKEVKVEVKTEKGTNPLVILNSSDKQLLGMIASFIRSLRPPEPYKGKGIRGLGEVVRSKDGKKA